MLLLFSGEGVSDIGSANHGVERVCEPHEWTPGPMALLADQIFKQACGYSAIDTQGAYFVPIKVLTSVGKELASSPKFCGKGMALYHRRGAQALASIALKLSKRNSNVPVIAIYFHDCDSSHSSGNSLWKTLRESKKSGFRLAGITTGVPMTPKPKSEAWLLCALKEQPYQSCKRLEDSPGNNTGKNPLKKRLQARLNHYGQDICTLIKPLAKDPLHVDAAKIKMPSFDAFRDDFIEALQKSTSNWCTPIESSLYIICMNAACTAFP